MKLNQVVAIERPTKQRVERSNTDIYHAMQKPDLYEGHYKKYEPLEAGKETFPPDAKHVQQNAVTNLQEVAKNLVELFDISIQRDVANCQAKADITVDGTVLAKDIPITFLMFLEKELNALNTVLNTIPTLDPAESWTFDGGTGMHKTAPRQTIKTAKVQEALVLYPATDKHPAQTQLISVDKIVGNWEAIRISGAAPAPYKKKLQERIQSLLRAVKCAREEANTTQAPEKPVGQKLMDWVFSV